MNERILQLAELAELHYNFDPTLWQKQEKFAELIVRECISIILHDGKTVADAMPTADRSNYTTVAEQIGIINGSMRYSNMIKQHFGVK